MGQGGRDCEVKEAQRTWRGKRVGCTLRPVVAGLPESRPRGSSKASYGRRVGGRRFRGFVGETLRRGAFRP